jgi:predicted nucleic acid-binding protein
VNGFLIDTNVLSEFARRQPADARVDRWLKTANEESLFVSVLTMAEIRRGVELLPAGKRRFELEAWYVALQVSFAAARNAVGNPGRIHRGHGAGA